ncbi:C4-dicarboxylate ABC transporter [Pseudomonas oryzihabitans]|uniref:TRAP transporter small permease n=1 Tax=Pseudomonas oryzihabitans TaxID=47885 RepID=UPI00165E8F9C|nr:TRAP transporter small permease [Pseudomonas psychrotolerans]QNQ99344.1 C4-dicarboxylate ABC transporter [Pseudomonas psychrotolerans]
MPAVTRLWCRLEEALVAFLLAVMTLITFFYVVVNNVYAVFYYFADLLPFLEKPLFAIGDGILFVSQEMTWSVALAKAVFGWLIFIGLAWGVRLGAHLGVDLLIKTFPPALRRSVALLAVGICIFYCGLMTYSSQQWVAALMNANIGAEDLDRFGLRQWHIVMIVPIGFGLMLIRFVEVFLRILRNEQSGFGGHSEAEDALKLVDGHQGTERQP